MVYIENKNSWNNVIFIFTVNYIPISIIYHRRLWSMVGYHWRKFCHQKSPNLSTTWPCIADLAIKTTPQTDANLVLFLVFQQISIDFHCNPMGSVFVCIFIYFFYFKSVPIKTITVENVIGSFSYKIYQNIKSFDSTILW